MPEFQVSCTTMSSGGVYHEHITHIGGSTGNGWRLTKESAIERIDAGKEQYYTVDKTTGKKVYIGVVRPADKDAYLRTHADGKWNDNLLALPACPSTYAVI